MDGADTSLCLSASPSLSLLRSLSLSASLFHSLLRALSLSLSLTLSSLSLSLFATHRHQLVVVAWLVPRHDLHTAVGRIHKAAPDTPVAFCPNTPRRIAPQCSDRPAAMGGCALPLQ